MALQQKVAVLVSTVIFHAAIRVSLHLITLIQSEIFVIVSQCMRRGFQADVAMPGSALCAVGYERCHFDSHRNTGLAGIAVRPIGNRTAPAEATPYQFRIHSWWDQKAGRGNLRACQSIRKVATRIRGCKVKLQRRQRNVMQQGHGRIAI